MKNKNQDNNPSFYTQIENEVVRVWLGQPDEPESEYVMDILDEQLEEKRQEEIKEQKRQELLARLTDFEKDLLGVK